LTKFIKLIGLELKKIFIKKSVLIILGIMMFLCLNIIWKADQVKVNNITHGTIASVNLLFEGCMQLFIAFWSATMLTEEFKYNTSSLLFTKSKTRTQILFIKIIAILCVGLIIAFLNYILIAYYKSLNHENIRIKELYKLLNVHIFRLWFVSNLIFFTACIFKTTVSSYITSMFFIYLISDFSQAFVKRLSLPKNLIRFNPFCNAVNYDHINFYQALAFILGGIVFFALTSFVFEKQDLI